MSIYELIAACNRAEEQGLARIPLVIPGGPPRGEKVRMLRRQGGPLGEVLNWQDSPPRTVASFKVADVRRWLCKAAREAERGANARELSVPRPPATEPRATPRSSR